MSYLLDSDVFIQAKNLHDGLDFCPAFWEWHVRRRLMVQDYGARPLRRGPSTQGHEQNMVRNPGGEMERSLTDWKKRFPPPGSRGKRAAPVQAVEEDEDD